MIKAAYRTFFGFTKEPFGADLKIEELLITPALKGVKDRLEYAFRLGAMAVVTGEVGSGKSTALRFATSHLHPSEWRLLWVTASCGSILELYRQLCWSLEMETKSSSRAVMSRMIQGQVQKMVEGKKQKVAMEVFLELHTLTQFEADSKPLLPIVFAGQNNLLDKLQFRASGPLSSRVVARSHLEGVDRAQMELYLNHHLQIAGVKQPLFADQAITAIHQGAGGLFRRANHLARGALIAAASEKCQMVSAEHVRIASSELIG